VKLYVATNFEQHGLEITCKLDIYCHEMLTIFVQTTMEIMFTMALKIIINIKLIRHNKVPYLCLCTS
jgi:hypothetical protein